ncbi:DUF1801 domain-containing protein [Proteiniclasticum sp. SCR006]|uniref:DUF1801 domain-containing protein n=1 Tax=Proteiniclasticum aestuarii TaxID=2817862 RepID=A0A939HD03_9CLOT|nr:DUF1801 domain-containing protein [Proteiniclasticum aestuarii]MBO1266080.1 DUF1801 domain-containing protein [Proteiniclasticum aestuarii]
MNASAETVEAYLETLPEERREAVEKLRETILRHLPKGFEETISYGMIGYVVPLSVYPEGYHAAKGEPLPFMSLASQKNHIALYHMGLYAKPHLEEWFREEYEKRVTPKLDMGKSCIRLKKMDQIPYDLIGELSEKITVEEYIRAYEEAMENRKKK